MFVAGPDGVASGSVATGFHFSWNRSWRRSVAHQLNADIGGEPCQRHGGDRRHHQRAPSQGAEKLLPFDRPAHAPFNARSRIGVNAILHLPYVRMSGSFVRLNRFRFFAVCASFVMTRSRAKNIRHILGLAFGPASDQRKSRVGRYPRGFRFRWTGPQTAGAKSLRRRISKPMPPKPSSSIAQVAGSGTAEILMLPIAAP